MILGTISTFTRSHMSNKYILHLRQYLRHVNIYLGDSFTKDISWGQNIVEDL